MAAPKKGSSSNVKVFKSNPKKYFTDVMIELIKWKKYRGEKEDNEILKALELE